MLLCTFINENPRHTNEKNSLLSMIPSDAPTSFDCVSCDTNQFNFRLLCVTEENDVNVFEELLSKFVFLFI